MNHTKLAVFDIDGTIAQNGTIDLQALDGIKSLQVKGYITSVCTGRGYHPVRLALGDAYDDVISDDALLVLEHGTRITDKQGNTVFAEYFDDKIIEHIFDFIRSNIEIVRHSWTNPDTIDQKVLVWCRDQAFYDSEVAKNSDWTDVFMSPLSEYKQRLLRQKVTNIEFKLLPHVQVQSLKLAFTRTPINAIFQDSNMGFIKNNTNKGIAILYLLKHLGIAYKDVLVAGNGMNDVEMLNLSVGHRILVGPESNRLALMPYLSEHESLTHVRSPQDLGKLLKSL